MYKPYYETELGELYLGDSVEMVSEIQAHDENQRDLPFKKAAEALTPKAGDGIDSVTLTHTQSGKSVTLEKEDEKVTPLVPRQRDQG